jgi:hypothetical protein
VIQLTSAPLEKVMAGGTGMGGVGGIISSPPPLSLPQEAKRKVSAKNIINKFLNLTFDEASIFN